MKRTIFALTTLCLLLMGCAADSSTASNPPLLAEDFVGSWSFVKDGQRYMEFITPGTEAGRGFEFWGPCSDSATVCTEGMQSNPFRFEPNGFVYIWGFEGYPVHARAKRIDANRFEVAYPEEQGRGTIRFTRLEGFSMTAQEGVVAFVKN